MESLSICLIVRDAAKFLPDCLASLSGLTAEIVVVMDDRTTDNTAQIAKQYTSCIYYRHFDTFAAQKNFALSHSSSSWCFFLDADERVTPDLAAEIKFVLANPRYSGYLIPRLNYIFGRPIYHTNWGPVDDSHIWLFKKSTATWQGDVHEEIVVSGPIGRLKSPKIHLAYRTVEEFIAKTNLYTSLETKAVHPLYDFGRRYIWHFGFLDGWHGLFLSYLMLIYHLSVWTKLWVKKNSSSS